MYMKKAQSALEYLTTYGWALLAIIGVIGIMTYTGVGDITSQIPTRCDLGTTIACNSAYGLIDGRYAFEITNNEESVINITSYVCTFPGIEDGLYFKLTTPVLMAVGETRTLVCDASYLAAYPLDYRGKKIYDVKVFYKLAEEQALPKIAGGEIVLGVTDETSVYSDYDADKLLYDSPSVYNP